MNQRFYKKSMVLLAIILLIIPSLHQVTAFDVYDKNDTALILTEIHIFKVPSFSVHNTDHFMKIKSETNTAYISTFGHPMLPKISQTFTFPFCTKIHSVTCSFSDYNEYFISKSIQPATIAIPKTKQQHPQDVIMQQQSYFEPAIYSTDQWYPSTSYSAHIHCGLQNKSRKVFVVVDSYPIKYHPSTNNLRIAQNMTIHITYELNPIKHNIQETYDMVIIAPRKYVTALTPLINHKNAQGIKTMIKTVESIYQDNFLGMFQQKGRDDAEKIKYFIHHAIEQWNITYVLLIGGHTHQSLRWEVPVRYSNLHDRSFWNDTYVTDLYFADVYRYNETTASTEFEDWDSNGNDIIGEWTWIYDPDRGWWYDLDKKDDLDLYPDVAVGRLACRNIQEVRTMVDKIIKYEQRSYGSEWFQRIICAGGDTVPYSDGICEGEIETNLGASHLESIGFDATRLWVTNEQLNAQSVLRELRKGAGFMYLSGHGTPLEWCTHPVSDGDTWIDVYAWMLKPAGNRYKLPVVVVGGCHNSQFDVSYANILKGVLSHGIQYFFWNEGFDCFPKWTWAPSCFSWNLISQKHDGCIAAIGNTGLGWGVGGENCVEYNEGYLTTRFFETYKTQSEQGESHLGIIHSETITKYISHFSANEDLLDRKTVEEWVLLGDPSLLIGGYN